jgi:hypothetical protein
VTVTGTSSAPETDPAVDLVSSAQGETSAGALAPASDLARRYAESSDGLQGALDQVIVGLPPIDPASPAARMTQAQGVRHLVQAVLAVVALAFAAELIATVVIRHVDPDLPIIGPEEVLLRVAAPASRGPYVAVLGDSVMTDVALRRSFGSAAALQTIPHRLRVDARSLPGGQLVGLGMEGALVNDYAGLIELLIAEGRPPAAVLVQLDYRVLSPVHDAEQNLSRRWLEPYMRNVEPAPPPALGSPEFLSRPIDDRVQHALLGSDAYVLLRGGRHVLSAAAMRVLGSAGSGDRGTPQDAEVLKLLVAPFYRTEIPMSRSRVLPDLLRFLDRLVARGTPVLICLTPTNFAFLGDQIDMPMYRANVAAVASAIRDRYAATDLVRWVSFEGDVAPALFIDHCHLTPAGNTLVADRMLANLDVLLARDTH